MMHFVGVLPQKKLLEREYYAEICNIERWSVRTLRERIDCQLYLRTALSKKPESLVDADQAVLRAREQAAAGSLPHTTEEEEEKE